MIDPTKSYREIVRNDEHLVLFLNTLREFDSHFCKFMNDGEDFTLRLEVRGNKQGIVHCRVSTEEYKHPTKGGYT